MKANTFSAGNLPKPKIVQKNDGQNFFVGSLPSPKIVQKTDGKIFRRGLHQSQKISKTDSKTLLLLIYLI